VLKIANIFFNSFRTVTWKRGEYWGIDLGGIKTFPITKASILFFECYLVIYVLTKRKKNPETGPDRYMFPKAYNMRIYLNEEHHEQIDIFSYLILNSRVKFCVNLLNLSTSPTQNCSRHIFARDPVSLRKRESVSKVWEGNVLPKPNYEPNWDN
jgi:hypothetical protein